MGYKERIIIKGLKTIAWYIKYLHKQTNSLCIKIKIYWQLF